MIVPPDLEKEGRQLLNNGARIETTGAPAGDTTHLAIPNEWAGTAELIVTPYL